MFNAHKEGASLQEDLEHNVEDAKKYAKLLAKNDECATDPDPEGQIACSAAASWFVPDQDPEKAPDVDISRTTTEASGEVGFGLSTHKGSDEDDNVANVGASGSMSDDVTVLRAQSGEDAGKITFVYTFTMSGKLEADAAGKVGASGEGTHMQQVAVTYDAEKYDKEKDDDEPHHPEKLEITTSQQDGVAGEGQRLHGGRGLRRKRTDPRRGGRRGQFDVHPAHRVRLGGPGHGREERRRRGLAARSRQAADEGHAPVAARRRGSARSRREPRTEAAPRQRRGHQPRLRRQQGLVGRLARDRHRCRHAAR